MAQTMRFRKILRRLAIVDEGFADDQAGLGFGLRESWALDPKTAALVRVAALAAIGSPEVCLEWSTSQALAPASSWPSPMKVLPISSGYAADGDHSTGARCLGLSQS